MGFNGDIDDDALERYGQSLLNLASDGNIIALVFSIRWFAATRAEKIAIINEISDQVQKIIALLQDIFGPVADALAEIGRKTGEGIEGGINSDTPLVAGREIRPGHRSRTKPSPQPR